MASGSIPLMVSEETINRYCEQIPRTARSTAHALATLVAVQTFVGAFAGPEIQTCEDYAAIRAVLDRHLGAMQQRLMDESGARLRAALAQEDVAEVARVHAALSRSGFAQALGVAIAGWPHEQVLRAVGWVQSWCTQARARAAAASGYPDALDFHGAGIALQEYAALADTQGVLSGLSLP